MASIVSGAYVDPGAGKVTFAEGWAEAMTVPAEPRTGDLRPRRSEPLQLVGLEEFTLHDLRPLYASGSSLRL